MQIIFREKKVSPILKDQFLTVQLNIDRQYVQYMDVDEVSQNLDKIHLYNIVVNKS